MMNHGIPSGRSSFPYVSPKTGMSERPFLTVDCVVFHGNEVVLIRRAHDPFKGWYALPGGFVEAGETVEDDIQDNSWKTSSFCNCRCT